MWLKPKSSEDLLCDLDGLVQGRCITIGSTLCGCIDANNMKHETK